MTGWKHCYFCLAGRLTQHAGTRMLLGIMLAFTILMWFDRTKKRPVEISK